MQCHVLIFELEGLRGFSDIVLIGVQDWRAKVFSWPKIQGSNAATNMWWCPYH